MIGRRSFITGLVSLIAAPAIVRAGSLMPVRVMIEPGIRYRAISVEEMIERMMGGPAISAALIDLGAFGTGVVEIIPQSSNLTPGSIRHVPLQEFYR